MLNAFIDLLAGEDYTSVAGGKAHVLKHFMLILTIKYNQLAS